MSNARKVHRRSQGGCDIRFEMASVPRGKLPTKYAIRAALPRPPLPIRCLGLRADLDGYAAGDSAITTCSIPNLVEDYK